MFLITNLSPMVLSSAIIFYDRAQDEARLIVFYKLYYAQGRIQEKPYNDYWCAYNFDIIISKIIFKSVERNLNN